MSDTITPANAESVGGEVSAPPNLRESFEAALEEHGLAEPEESGAEPKEVEPATPASKEPEKAEKPEHIAWAESIEGNLDKESGQLNYDRLVKQAFELNKNFQPTAQELAKYRQAFQHPKIQAVLQELVSGKEVAPAKEDSLEKTDEQIFKEMVRREAEELIRPERERIERMYSDHITDKIASTYSQLQEAFGKTEDGNLVYDTALDNEVGAALAAEAQRLGQNWDQLKVKFAEQGVLFNVFKTAATNILYPKMVSKLAQTSKAQSESELAKQKGAQLPTRGSSAKNVREKTPEVNSFQDAVRLAEQQNPELKNLR